MALSIAGPPLGGSALSFIYIDMFLNFLKLPTENKKTETIAQGRGTIFVVEDDEAIRESLCGMLNDEGYQVKIAENGLAALAKTNKPFGAS